MTFTSGKGQGESLNGEPLDEAPSNDVELRELRYAGVSGGDNFFGFVGCKGVFKDKLGKDEFVC